MRPLLTAMRCTVLLFVTTIIALMMEYHHTVNITIQTNYDKTRGNTSHCPTKYMQSLTKQLRDVYSAPSTRNKITTAYINDYIVNRSQWIASSHSASQYLRIKFISGQLYLSKYQSSLSYRFSWWLYYYMRLFEKYGTSGLIPDIDFVVFMGDVGDTPIDYNVFPFFVGEGIEIKNKTVNGITVDQLPLFTMPRSYIWLHQSPVEGYADIMCYRDSDGFNTFENKLNKAVFRGGPTGGDWRYSKRGQIIIPSTDNNITVIDAKYSCWRDGQAKRNSIPMKYCTVFTNSTEQMKYRYIILVDGNSVRDAFPKQLGIGSIVLKQKSQFIEFWYPDLINHYHVIEWTDYKELKDIMYNLTNNRIDMEKQKQIARNGRYFVDTYLVDSCIDAFVIEMMRIYNYYFFDEESVTKSAYDILINNQTIKALLKQGYKKHIFDFEYHCATNNKIIVSQKV
eukprot:75440_1